MKIIKAFFTIILFLIFFNILRLVLLPALDSFIYKKIKTAYYQHVEPKTKNECLKKGGYWGKAGLFPKEFCRTPSKDFGKTCYSGFQCQWGQCLSRLNLRQPAVFSSGKCPLYRSNFGCMQWINFGFANKGLCLD